MISHLGTVSTGQHFARGTGGGVAMVVGGLVGVQQQGVWLGIVDRAHFIVDHHIMAHATVVHAHIITSHAHSTITGHATTMDHTHITMGHTHIKTNLMKNLNTGHAHTTTMDHTHIIIMNTPIKTNLTNHTLILISTGHTHIMVTVATDLDITN